ncbi:MAG: hypothetical protein Q4F54_05320 [Coriobacteriia bacterium]|nr:hypothetical protein [Coriobacteriia bacterium]
MEVIPEVESPYIPIEGATSSNYLVDKNAFLGTMKFAVDFNVTTDNDNFNSALIRTTGVNVSLLYMKMTFKDLQNDTTTVCYTKYGTNELYDSETSENPPVNIPTATKEGFVFNG